MCWSWANIDWGATGAWAQTIATAGAVFGAAWLQDRSLAKRAQARRAERLEVPATAARFALGRYQALLKRTPFVMPVSNFADHVQETDFAPGIAAMQLVDVAELGDVYLFGAVLEFRARLQQASDHLLGMKESYKNSVSMATVHAQNLVAEHETDLFNAAAAIERRVAQLIGRSSLLKEDATTMSSPQA